jgi:succinyl-diaminopimelate desuccinylase
MKNIPADPVAILQDLIRCPSITPHDHGALAVVENLLSNAGFATHRLVFKDQNTPDIDNLFARYGTKGPHLCFAGHTDVVPVGNEAGWTSPPFAAEIHNGQIYGRGATDMKGSVAAFTAAACDYVRENPKFMGSISFLITGDEEGPAINGTVKVLEWMKKFQHVPDHCVVGEPTCAEALGDTIKIGRRGSLSFTVTVEGKQGHVAYPEKVSNPVAKLARFVDRVSSSAIDSGNDHFDPSSLQVTTFDVGNTATNVVPAKAITKLNIRFSTENNYDSLRTWINTHIEAVKAEMGGTWHVTTNEGAEAFITQPGAFVGLVQDAVQEETGVLPKLSTTGGTSDARFIKDYCSVLEFGPTNATIHQVDERISVEELKATTQIYRRIIDVYFATST